MDLGDRMKFYENRFQQDLCPLVPAIVRLDGRAFHTFCKKMQKPFDADFHRLMTVVTRKLMEETGANFGYTQSDEISLLFYSDTFGSQIFFNGNVMKMVSTLAALGSVYLQYYGQSMLEKSYLLNSFPTFDSRIANYPIEEVANYFVWREKDAVRNSILAMAQANFSHNSIQGLSCDELQEKLFQEKNINWNDCPSNQKRGTYVRMTKVFTPFTPDEIATLPPLHNARKNPDLVIERNRMEVLDLSILTKIKNRTEVIMYGAEPELYEK
jgi:tRNA(His) 5'-end guanylyltransferase